MWPGLDLKEKKGFLPFIKKIGYGQRVGWIWASLIPILCSLSSTVSQMKEDSGVLSSRQWVQTVVLLQTF